MTHPTHPHHPSHRASAEAKAAARKARHVHERKQRVFFWYCLSLAVVVLLVWILSGNSNPYYQRSWKTEVDNRNAQRARIERRNEEAPSSSKQPKAPGMREKEIKKYHGHRYDTF